MDDFPIAQVTFEKFVYGGDVLARLPDGRVIFVPFGIPGETARVRVTEEKRRYARGEIVELLSASPLRIDPRCQHFTLCGGCSYQHIDHAAQLKAKEDILREQLSRVFDFDDASLTPDVFARDEWHYRNHVQFQVSSAGKLGYHRSRSRELIPILECYLPEPPIDAVWPLIDLEANVDLDKISLRSGSEGDVQVLLHSKTLEIPEIVIEGMPVSVVHDSSDGPKVIADNLYIWIEVLDYEFRVSAGSFFQVNAHMAGEMVKYVLDQVPLSSREVVMDLYSGVGLFSYFIAPRVAGLVAVEESPYACEDYEYNLDAFDHIELYEARVEDVLGELDRKVDVIFVDPPRSGLQETVVHKILSLHPKTLVYVSCDPSSLGRDARSLVAGGYGLRKIALFDLFPQTSHIESITIWHRSN